MRFEKYRGSLINKVNKEENEDTEIRMEFKDFVALSIATFEVMVPILIVILAIVLVCVFIRFK